MKLDKVRKLSPFERLCYWITERESVRFKKGEGEFPPWTDDPILQSYRFCNVRRMDDKVSQWLLTNWYRKHESHRNSLYACALARFINKPESLALITDFVYCQTSPKWERIKSILRSHRDKGNTIFNGAYMVRGNDGMDKIECVVDYYVKPLVNILKNGINTLKMERCWDAVKESYGMGSFMAGQVVADMRWAVVGQWKDSYLWAPLGPGSKRGMNRLLGRELNTTMPQTEFVCRLLRDVINPGTKAIPKPITERLEAIDWQNCLCEYDKYNRVLFGEGRPKARYNGA